MYESQFQLQARPFVAAPRGNCYVPQAAMEQPRQTLIRCVERAEGPGLIVGPAGTGKSLLCLLLAEHFRNQQFQVALLASARLSSRRALLQNILFELQLPYRGMEEEELRLSLIDHLEPRGGDLAGLLLLVDEAHTLPVRLLDEVRLISNFIRDGQPRVRLILAGNAQLEERLASPKLESLQQRIAARCYLHSLNREETAEYIRQQIQQAGGNPQLLFTASALKAVFAATDGVPRLINQVCDHAMVLSALGGHEQISAEGIEEAWADLQQLPAPWHQSSRREALPAASAEVEFGQLPDEGEPASTAERAEKKLDDLERTMAALDSAEGIELGTRGDVREDAGEFEPVGELGTQVELTFETPANPFGDGFDAEEMVVDHFASLAETFRAGGRDDVSDVAAQIVELASHAASAPQAAPTPASALPTAAERDQTDEENLVFSSADATEVELDFHESIRLPSAGDFNPASDPVLPDDGPRRPLASKPRTKRREYRTLFSTLRQK